ncbi:MAG: YlxR family protein [Sciscionella sp.]|nr:YlxR family protein [Sciscionella sp.]
MRTCVGCRGKALAAELLRVVVVDGVLVIDRRRRLPGRGAWLHPDPSCLRDAGRRRAFPRALRVSGPLDVTPVHDQLAATRSASTGAGSSRTATPTAESRSTRHESAVKLKP